LRLRSRLRELQATGVAEGAPLRGDR
jgi:hypothetical protein